MSDVVIRAENVTKRFRLLKSERTMLRALRAVIFRRSLHMSYPVIEDVSFEIRRGERVAILGENGAGKSTFMRLISGILKISSGRLSVSASTTGVFAGQAGMLGDLSVMDNIDLLGAICQIPAEEMVQKRDEILEFAGLSKLRYARLKELSSGQQKRLALSIFFHTRQELVLLDETLSHVDAAFAQRCEDRFVQWSKEGRTFVVVSHDLDFVRRFCDRVIWLADRRIRAMGPAGEITDAYQKEEQARASAQAT